MDFLHIIGDEIMGIRSEENADLCNIWMAIRKTALRLQSLHKHQLAPFVN